MDTITVKEGTQIYFKDWGTGEPLFFHHGCLVFSYKTPA
jgi:non-heme chloroperoxidase